MQKITLINDNCLSALGTLDENSIDSIVTDPPYELGFMGKSWDETGISNNAEMWKECLRVLKPGGHLLSFSGTRTYHRMATAIEDAGFEVRDMIEWVYGSGFPKSLNIGKAVDKLQGNERQIVGTQWLGGNAAQSTKEKSGTYASNTKWEGWGTALKPAHEPICMARKPLSEKTVAENCLKWGTGGIDIDGSRVSGEATPINKLEKWSGFGQEKCPEYVQEINTLGRFPANLIHDGSEEVKECFPETKSGGGLTKRKNEDAMFNFGQGYEREEISDFGNASRFFKSIIYTAKASKSERNKGCEELEEKTMPYGSGGGEMPNGNDNPKKTKNRNNHPTVKPVALMEYLIKMVTVKGGTVLDPFMGSGSTGIACVRNGYAFVGIELEKAYWEIAKSRIYS